MITVLFFAQTKELVGTGKLELTGEYATAEAIREELSKKEGKWDLALEKGKLLVAINQTISSLDSAVVDGDEVAFFPPVTGG
ncbi:MULTISPECIES: molybdopterin synthase sulfur carrier subunit [Aliivibrio]|jgi:molybdopterin synthase sulfur carrier subunit|uniref:Molybdopterin synthase sulfur carrier subunit n=3 Tax=Aliivibrio TaxID=511678 RepID=A0A1B9P1G4_ALILO|nr:MULTISPECIES: molybdopterin synthase sulfur carrier subunit [Aliivibrio]AZL85083.1 molybdopterin synthase sulfur carrier subunit [Aliivibrio salmonicida]MBB1314532.1 molybdopterin synthase sulfur carrier subunit [Aliivibrio sp. SR45-2]OCH22202.1 molybdopterin synthase sulfur carrier subunit [Aliivibrio logei]OEF10913.1 molybdopterin synthase sulfur carrier subunit [Aliivibrio logei 5S-186]CAQ79564.1 molybdopterin-converting factor subunit 1 [Aliivibrio salmonicida LFI1238]